MPEITLSADARLIGGVEHIPVAAWDRLRPTSDPFTAHAFLLALERSGSASAERGWQPLHLVLGDPAAPHGVVPLYAKAHSWGEYVFDHGWADAYERSGASYYPKLQAAVPFTPVPGARLLAGGDADLRARLAEALASLPQVLGLSSVHVTFCTAEEAASLRERGWLVRRGIQYHWHNRDYDSFDAFLAALRSSRRKTVRRERREIAAAGIEIEVLHGDALSPEDLESFYPFYLATVDRRWGAAYLTRAFFRELGRGLRDRVVLVRARDRGRVVAGALNLLGPDTLYGRLWGSLDDYRFLHFECCYYRAIEFAITHRLARVEAGAQGMHKLLRGYEPVWTWSAHRFADPAFSAAIARFLGRETRALEAEFARMRELLPYAEGAGAG